MTQAVKQPYRVLVVDDEDSMRFVLRELLSREGCIVDEAEDGEQAVAKARKFGYDLYLLDVRMPKLDGISALREIRRMYPQALAIMITAFGTTQVALEALQAGAFDYFTKPFNIDELRLILLRALEKQSLLQRINDLRQQLSGRQEQLNNIVGRSETMQRVFDLIQRVAEHDVTVLIQGESGTGKELVAGAIHDNSARSDGPMIKVNCAAIPEPLLESELFGHERGSFTGATHSRPGKFEAADGGTIMLDEIGEMPLALQSKMLRVLQEREVERVGSNKPISVDIRVVAATNRDLAQMVRDKEFREDLYFRLNVMPISLPPLRERLPDLPVLADYFLGEFNARMGKLIRGIAPAAMDLIENYQWPGNVRELENIIQRAMIMAPSDLIDVDDLPAFMRQDNGKDATPETALEETALAEININLDVPMTQRIEQLTERVEMQYIRAALEKTNGHRQETADLLGISRKSLHNKMQKYEMFEKDAREA